MRGYAAQPPYFSSRRAEAAKRGSVGTADGVERWLLSGGGRRKTRVRAPFAGTHGGAAAPHGCPMPWQCRRGSAGAARSSLPLPTTLPALPPCVCIACGAVAYGAPMALLFMLVCSRCVCFLCSVAPAKTSQIRVTQDARAIPVRVHSSTTVTAGKRGVARKWEDAQEGYQPQCVPPPCLHHHDGGSAVRTSAQRGLGRA